MTSLALLALLASPLEVHAWPAPAAPLQHIPLLRVASHSRMRVFIDAGHGAPGNEGALSAWCEREQDFTARVAEDLKRRLERTGAFEVRLSRAGPQRVRYVERVRAAEAFRAEAIVSLHFDARGEARVWRPRPDSDQVCLRSEDSAGFSVLWSDEAPDLHIRRRRHRLASHIAEHLTKAGFLPYHGLDYLGLYEGDVQVPGLFVDRQAPGKRVFLLRRPAIPSVIVETHHGLDVEETLRWREARTLEAFAAALGAALLAARNDDVRRGERAR